MGRRPYFQTKRFDRYNNVIDEMLEAGTAYKCYCSKERLRCAKSRWRRVRSRVTMAAAAIATSTMLMMSRASCVSPTQEGSVIFDDQIRGPIEFSNQNWTI